MKKNECANRLVCLFFSVAVAVLCVLFAGMEAKSIMHVYDLKPASASLISPELSRSTRTSAEELTGLRQVSVRLEADQRLRHRSGVEIVVLIMLAVLLANTVFYKAKKRLLTEMMLTADGLLSVTSIIRMDRNTEDHIPLFNIADCCKCFHYE